MVDLNKLRIKGNKEQERAVIQAARAVEKYSDPGVVKKLHERTTCFVFNDIKDKRLGGYYTRLQEQDVVVLPAGKFEKFSLKTRHRIICHELAHADWREKRKNKFTFPSKENELQAYHRDSLSIQNFEEANEINPFLQKTLKFFGVTAERSTKEIKKALDESPVYKCKPEKEPMTLFEKKKAIKEYEACEEKMEDESIFKSKPEIAAKSKKH